MIIKETKKAVSPSPKPIADERSIGNTNTTTYHLSRALELLISI